MEILLAGLLALSPVVAVPQAAAVDTCTTGRTSYCTSQAPRNCKTVRAAGGRTITFCTSQKPRNCKVLTTAGGTRIVCLSRAPRF